MCGRTHQNKTCASAWNSHSNLSDYFSPITTHDAPAPNFFCLPAVPFISVERVFAEFGFSRKSSRQTSTEQSKTASLRRTGHQREQSDAYRSHQGSKRFSGRAAVFGAGYRSRFVG